MKFQLPYGHSIVDISLPDDLDISEIVPAEIPKMGSDKEIVSKAIQNPLGTPLLENILAPRSKTIIVIPDKTRNARTDIVLPILLDEIQSNGIRSEDISFLFANGSHAEMTLQEKQAILGKKIAEKFHFVEHDCSTNQMEFVGTTERGIPVRVNKILFEAENVIVVGTVVHHYFAGFGGGPKMIVPGVAACETITQNHRMAVMSEDSVLHPKCLPGNVEGNPVYEDIEEAFKMVNVDFSVQVVLDGHHGIQAAFSGDTLLAHKRGREIIEKMNRVPIDRKFDCVIVSAGGFPKDLNVIQAHKAIYNGFQAVKSGGCMIILAECADGIGSKTFLQWFDYSSLTEMKRAVMANYALNGNTALSLKEKLDQTKMYVISKLEEGLSRKIGFVPVRFFKEAWALATSDFKIDSVAVLPNGDVTLPEVKLG